MVGTGTEKTISFGGSQSGKYQLSVKTSNPSIDIK